MSDTIEIQLIRSPIGLNKKQKGHLTGLGLKKSVKEESFPNTPSVLGMVAKVQHMVTFVEEK